MQNDLTVAMSRHKKYPTDPYTDTVTIPKWEYDALREISRLHTELLDRLKKVMPTVYSDFKKSHP